MKPGHPAMPPDSSRPWLATAAGCWVAIVLVDAGAVGVFAVGIGVAGLVVLKHPIVGIAVTLAALAGLHASRDLPPLEDGPTEVSGALVSEVHRGKFGRWVLLGTEDGPVLLDLDQRPGVGRGDRVLVSGAALSQPGEVAGVPYRGVLRVEELTLESETGSPVHLAGRAVRSRVAERLEPVTDRSALLSGFLVGDVSGVSQVDIVAMRRAGLSHFTAVSGSNVALFLGLLFVLSGPLALGPKRRAVVGLAGLPVYAAATGFEPSVMRATVMAGIVFAGRLAGFSLEAWQLLAGAVMALVIVDPFLVSSVGFQLSVVATAGVLVGARWPVGSSWLRRALAVTLGAQGAVAPLLVIHFGAVPLLSPLLNVIAAPLVVAATLLGGVGVLGIDISLNLALWLAGLVLALARGAASWPQIPAAGLIGVMAGVGAAVRWPGLRPILVLGLMATISIAMIRPTGSLPDPGLVVLDVGQGDSILLSSGGDRFVLIDGGPDPVVLLDRLVRYRVRSLEVVVLTHVHADHVAGLTGLVDRIPIGEVWARTAPHTSAASAAFFEALAESGVPVLEPDIGRTMTVGSLRLTVLGPLRRYASPNDQSIVLHVEGPGRSALLSGDIEVVAQSELRNAEADVLKVPHQGAATSDPEWLVGVGSELAVISVGPNDFGHPAPWVINVLVESGARVVRTDQEGDVVVPLG